MSTFFRNRNNFGYFRNVLNNQTLLTNTARGITKKSKVYLINPLDTKLNKYIYSFCEHQGTDKY